MVIVADLGSGITGLEGTSSGEDVAMTEVDGEEVSIDMDMGVDDGVADFLRGAMGRQLGTAPCSRTRRVSNSSTSLEVAF